MPMNQSALMRSIGFTCCCLLVPPSLQAGEPLSPDLSGKVQQAVCFSSHNEYREPAMYVSDVFEIRVPQNAGRMYPRDMAKVFVAYLKQQHGYVDTINPTVFCSLHDTVQMAQGTKDLLIKQHQYYKQSVVETGWRMSTQQAEAAATAAAAKPATLAPSAPRSPSMAYGYCKSSDYRIAYYSAAFGSPIDTDPRRPTWDLIQTTGVQWRQSFIEFLKKKYGFVGYTQCPSYASQAESQKDFDNMIRLARSAPPGRSVETGWVYVAAAPVAAAPAAPAVPAAPPKPATTSAARPAPAPAPASASASAASAPTPAAVSSIHAVCWADRDPATRYYSAVFSGSGSDYADWMPAFKQFMQQKFNYRQSVRCTKQVNQAEAQKYRAQMIDDARTIPLPGGAHPKIIETGWTYP
jgi:hypothetical protein